MKHFESKSDHGLCLWPFHFYSFIPWLAFSPIAEALDYLQPS